MLPQNVKVLPLLPHRICECDRNGVFADIQGKMRSSGWTLIQYERCSRERGMWTQKQVCTQVKYWVKMEVMLPQAWKLLEARREAWGSSLPAPAGRTCQALTFSWMFSFQKCETIPCCCLSLPVLILCYSSPGKLNQKGKNYFQPKQPKTSQK